MREISRDKVMPFVDAAVRFLGGGVLCCGQVLGGYAPFALGWMAASGGGRAGLFALLGVAAGAAAFLPFSAALRTVAASVLIFSANNAFALSPVRTRRLYLPVLTVSMFFAVEFVYLTRAGAAQAAYCLLSAGLAALFSVCCSPLLQKSGEGKVPPAVLAGAFLGFLSAAVSVQLHGGFTPGRIPALALVILLSFAGSAGTATAFALCVGLVMDLAAPESRFLYAAVCAFCSLAVSLERRQSRVRAALLFIAAAAAFALPLGTRRGAMLLYEALAAALIFLLLPPRLLRGKREARVDGGNEEEERSAVRRLLDETAAALREIYESISRVPPPPEENPAVIFDRAAERVCRSCRLKHDCWHENYSRTYNALNDATAALLEHGVGKGEYFPPHFANRCIRFPSFLSAVTVELNAFLLRRNYRARLSDSRSRSAQQYAQLSELLSASAESVGAAKEALAAALPYRIGQALRARNGAALSGDAAASFEAPGGKLCLILSDGMGSGEAAHREAAMAVRLLERFLKAGIEPRFALKTLSGALALKGEATQSFTTVDLLVLSLADGEAQLYKLGAAPSYIKRGRKVRRVTCSCLPAGLAAEEQGAEATQLRMEKGNFLVMLTDGVADASDDKWLTELLGSWDGGEAQKLACAIMDESEKRRGCGDDAAVLVLEMAESGSAEV